MEVKLVKKSLLLGFAVTIIIALLGTGCMRANAPDDDVPDDTSMKMITVGFSQLGAESDWRTADTESMKAIFTEENGYKLIFDDARQKQENQITAIRNFIQQEVDYIVLAPVTEKGWDTVLREAKDARIPVIIVDRMIDTADDSLFTAWVGSDFREEGDKAVDFMESTFGDRTINIVHIQGTMGSSAQIGRTEALEEGIAQNPGWNILLQETGDFTRAKSKEVMKSALRQFGNINVVYCENDNEAFGVIEAIEEAGFTCGLNGDIVIISFDATNAGLTETLAGKISYDVECNPLHGPRVEAIIRQLENGEKPEKLSYVDETAFKASTITREMIELRTY